MGTPEFAVPSLTLLASHHEVVDVITQPDRPSGRGRRLHPPPIKRKAQELGLAVYQPQRVRDQELYERLVRDAPQVVAVVGYGQMLSQRILSLPAYGCVNVHSSLLPKYRGAAPVNWALANGESRTGVTTMRLVQEMDAGDILLTHETVIEPDETASELNRRLAPVGARLLLDTLTALEAGTLQPVPQDHANASLAPRLCRDDGRIDWSMPAHAIYNRQRGFDPWPGIFSFFRGKRLRIWSARPCAGGALPPGKLQLADGQLSVGCGSGRLVLEEVQLEGRTRVAALDFARGWRLARDEVLRNE